eukprot:1127300-Rhodomonas_salina.1
MAESEERAPWMRGGERGREQKTCWRVRRTQPSAAFAAQTNFHRIRRMRLHSAIASSSEMFG